MSGLSYKELLEQKAALENAIKEARDREVTEAVAKVKSLVSDFGLTAEDVFGRTRSATAANAKGTRVAPKYRNPATGETWTGRGKAPKWISDQDRAQFLIPDSAQS